jgi:Flp pilus assembly protein TadB
MVNASPAHTRPTADEIPFPSLEFAVPRYVYRPSLLARLFRWSAAFCALYLVLYFLSWAANDVLSVAGPFVIVAALVWCAVTVSRRGRDR